MKLKVIPTQPQEPWFADGLSFQCTCSGNCCTGGPGFVWVEEWEIERLAEHFKVSRDEAFAKYCRKVGRKVSLKEKRSPQGNYDSVFLTELEPERRKSPATGEVPLRKRVCGIYPVRPLQ